MSPAQIFSAFAARPIPTRAEGFGRILEAQEVADALCGVDREDVTFELLEHDMVSDHSACIFFLTAADFLYYMPAFLVLCMRDFDRSDLPFSLVGYFADEPEFRTEKQKEILSELRPAEKAALAEFITFLHREYGEEFMDGSLDGFRAAIAE